jgi:hypothetical protein
MARPEKRSAELRQRSGPLPQGVVYPELFRSGKDGISGHKASVKGTIQLAYSYRKGWNHGFVAAGQGKIVDPL